MTLDIIHDIYAWALSCDVCVNILGYSMTNGPWGIVSLLKLPLDVHSHTLAAGDSKGKETQWVSAPAPAETIPGLQYLTEIDQLLVEQQVELLEGEFRCIGL